MPARVVVVQRRLTSYRVEFFNQLKVALADVGVHLDVVYGDGKPDEVAKKDGGVLEWGLHVPSAYVGPFCWQNPSGFVRDADLVIITAENKLLWNVVAQYWRIRPKIAFWGHGANMQGDAGSLRERFKRFRAKHVDWWFGYTEVSRPYILASGFPGSRVTIVNNTVDLRRSHSQLASLTNSELAALRQRVGLFGQNVAIFVGSLYAEKRISFLIKSAIVVRESVPDFELVIVGAGVDMPAVLAAAKAYPWIKYVGQQSGREKMAFFALAKIMVNPGLVGLGILDAFVAGVPVLTTDCKLHSPEIAYLEHGRTGVVTANSSGEFASACVELLEDHDRRGRMATLCRMAAASLQLDQMVARFKAGILACLAEPRLWRGRSADPSCSQ